MKVMRRQNIMKFKLLIVLVLGFLITGCAAQIPFKMPSSKEGAGLEEKDVSVSGPNRGVVIDFQKGKPMDPIFGDFLVGLNIANYMDDYVSVSLNIWDTSPLEGFSDQEGVSMSLEPAIYDRGEFYQPFTERHNMGIFNYLGVKQGDYTQFLAEVRYDVRSDVESNVCVTNPDFEKESTCSEIETISGSRLGDKNSRYPVTVKSLKKSFYGGGEGLVLLNLDVTLSDQGNGEIIDPHDFDKFQQGFVEFNIFPLSGADDFNCRSDDAVNKMGEYDSDFKSLPLTLKMDKNKSPVIKCTSSLSVYDPLLDVRVRITTEYGYKYITSTGKIEVKG